MKKIALSLALGVALFGAQDFNGWKISGDIRTG